MQNNLIGCFYFKQTSNGNLIGEFTNNKEKHIYTESADLVNGSGNYVGKYISTWQGDGNTCFTKLQITYKSNTDYRIFSLDWDLKNNRKKFKGLGMLCDNILIGNYQEVEI